MIWGGLTKLGTLDKDNADRGGPAKPWNNFHREQSTSQPKGTKASFSTSLCVRESKKEKECQNPQQVSF
ncbi:hypothetical protein F0562_026411 [Nyssa sinensis]|uniref:Uncharacterized protein n=1 Tax=Nyssa sinensis TaxID=561372 RepID=A0A5J5BAM7_9ASTE|nr:hypothetical protein F0562_026411 [Nyssa sinensis]